MLQEHRHGKGLGQGHWEYLGYLWMGKRKAVLACDPVEVADIEQKPCGTED